MNATAIDKFIAIKRKSDSSIRIRHDFQEEWLKLTRIEGLNTETIKYLYDGFSFAGSLPLVIFLRENESAFTSFQDFFISCDYADKNRTITTKLLLHMFALVLKMLPENHPVIKYLIKELPYYCNDKNGGITDRIIFIKYFVQELSDDTIFPVIEISDIQPSFNSFCSKLMKNIDSVINEEDTNINENIMLSKVKNWISNYFTEGRESIQNRENKTVITNPSGKNKTGVNCVIQKAQAAQTLHAKDYLNIIMDSVSNLDRITGNLQKDNSSYISVIEQLRNEVDEKSRLFTQEKNQRQNTDVVLSQANVKIVQLIDTINKQENLLASKDTEIKSIEKQGDILLRDKDAQREEFINRISSDLEIEYKDFLSANNCSMTLDLGENMREQLKSVFTILKKHGIKLE